MRKTSVILAVVIAALFVLALFPSYASAAGGISVSPAVYDQAVTNGQQLEPITVINSGGGFPYCYEWLFAWFHVASWANTRGGPVIIPIVCIPDGFVCFVLEDNRFRSIAWSSVSYVTLFAEAITAATVPGDHGRNMVALL